MTIKIRFKPVFFFFFVHNIQLSSSMIWVSTFFQHKILMCLYPGLYNRLQDLINVDLLAHLPICITRHIVEIDLRLEIVSNRSPTIIAFLAFFGRLIMFLNTILTITHTWFSNNIELVLGVITKMHFIAKLYPILIL